MKEWIKVKKIGEKGGFGEVYLAKLKSEGQIQQDNYALKELTQDDEESINRFKREVRILKGLNHPRIVKVIDCNLIEKPLFYVMSIYKGSLNKYLSDIKDNNQRIKTVFNNIFDGVKYLHEQGVYHRDLKPANILMNSDMDLVISDFGLGLNLNLESTRLTQTGERLGTYLYMAPEQFEDGKHVDHRADIYSIGKIIYECYTGKLKSLSINMNLLPSGIKYVVNKCVSYKPDDRFQNINELRESFNSAVDILINGSVKKDINDILNIISSSEINMSLVEQFCAFISKIDIDNDLDMVHQIVMKLPAKFFVLLLNYDKDLDIKIIKLYVSYITSQGWPFDYTDSIGIKCRNIFNLINDCEIKASLLYAVGQVGISHNRWYVMDLFREMIYSVHDDTEALYIIEKLKPISNQIRRISLDESQLSKIIYNALFIDSGTFNTQ